MVDKFIAIITIIKRFPIIISGSTCTITYHSFVYSIEHAFLWSLSVFFFCCTLLSFYVIDLHVVLFVSEARLHLLSPLLKSVFIGSTLKNLLVRRPLL